MRYLLALWSILFVAIVLVAKPPQFSLPAEKPPQFSLAEDVPTLPTDPSQPAPQGYQWQSRNGGPWQLVRVSEVASPSPFSDTMQATTARRVAGQNMSYRASTGTGRTIIGVGMMVQRGGTDCPPSG